MQQWLTLSIPVITALLLGLGKGYRPFPSIDDFAYMPLTEHFLDPTAYPRDTILRGYSFHMPIWALLVWCFKATTGLALGFWLSTLLLGILTVLAVWCLMRALGGSATFLPLAGLLAFAGRTPGLGRGLYDGAFGNAFHMQWLALCLLLWCYVAFIRRSALATGVLLGLTTLVHPVVGAHGAVVVFLATMWDRTIPLRRLGLIALTTAVISAPVTVPQALQLSSTSTAGLSWSTADLIQKGYLFRTSHEFTLELTPPAAAGSLLLLTALGGCGAVLLGRYRTSAGLRPVLGLWAGHGLLLLGTVLFHGPFLPDRWKLVSLLPYLFHLSRTTPLFVVLACVLTVEGLASMFETRAPGGKWTRLLRLVFLVALICFSAVFVTWNSWLVMALLLATVGRPLRAIVARSSAMTQVAVLLAAVATASLLVLSWPDRLTASIRGTERELYTWVETNTEKDALFVVPPGFQEFRAYTHRSVFVDFKLFPASTPRLIPEWRRRLELITRPDKKALAQRGWDSTHDWDRCYAQGNSAARISQILEDVGADYFILDQRGLEIPPFIEFQDVTLDERLRVVFANERFRVLTAEGQGER